MLLYPEGMIKLNESAAAIGGLIDGQRSVRGHHRRTRRAVPGRARARRGRRAVRAGRARLALDRAGLMSEAIDRRCCISPAATC
ncbi:MAG: hypothetical protein VB137_10060 [Burkholderia sp.]